MSIQLGLLVQPKKSKFPNLTDWGIVVALAEEPGGGRTALILWEDGEVQYFPCRDLEPRSRQIQGIDDPLEVCGIIAAFAFELGKIKGQELETNPAGAWPILSVEVEA